MSDEKNYIKQFKVFESEVDVGFKNIVFHFGINRISIKNTQPLQSTAEFWNYSLYNAATVAIMTLGRIFDVNFLIVFINYLVVLDIEIMKFIFYLMNH